jgi:photosystem II stability/assembly factor-like uncharacterized protein
MKRALATGRTAAFALALGALATPASAHAPPLAARVLADPSGGDDVIVSNRGLVFRDTVSGASRLLCNEALHITTAELPNVARLADGSLLVASSRGLRLTRDQGCSWADVGGMGTTHTPALAAVPGDPDTIYVASYSPEGSSLRLTRDGGRSWSVVMESSGSDYVHSLLVARADPAHVYATQSRFTPSQPVEHALLRSTDGGRTWERRPLPLGERDYAALAATTDPADPAVVVVYSVANSPGLDDARLLVSRDAGDSFEVALTLPELRGADHDDDGRLWVAARDGLYRALAPGAGFERVSTASELGCVSATGGGLLVCGHYAGVEGARSGVGVSLDAGQSFEPLLDFDGVTAPVVCGPSSLTTSQCAQPWDDWQLELLAPELPGSSPYGPAAALADGGAPDVMAGDAAGPGDEATASGGRETPATPGCGLQRSGTRAGQGAANGAVLLAALASSLWRWRRRRSDNPHP